MDPETDLGGEQSSSFGDHRFGRITAMRLVRIHMQEVGAFVNRGKNLR